MANKNNPFGFKAINKMDGSPVSGAIYAFFVPASDATALFLGDPVDLVGGSNTADQNGFKAGTLPIVTKASEGATNKILGFVESIYKPESIDDSLRTIYRKASTATVIYVTLANNNKFEAQADEDIVAADISSNADYAAGSGGNTVTGYSSAQIDSSSIGNDATKQLTLLRLKNEQNNELGNYAKCEVYVNQPRLAPATVGV